jgi:hypothetical protein
MKLKISRSRSWGRLSRDLLAVCCALVLVPGEGVALAQEAAKAPAASPAPASPAEPPAAKIPPEQLESLVAPIALYPDPLLAQTLVASTYPLEIIQLHQWVAKHPDLKDKALADSVAKQPWDPSIQSMAAFPDVTKRLADDIQWTTDLGNAFLAQQTEVMDAVQRMRKKAKDNGALESNEQQKVETKVVEQKTVIVVESANPEVIYVPSYSPTVVYGAPIYPYPPIYYPPYPPGAAFVSFSFGVMMGAAFWGGSCCGCGWGGNNVNINVNNNFNQINHNVNRGGGGGNWQHNPQHRGGAPYSNKATANKYGGSTRGGSSGGRGASAGQQPARQPGGAGNKAGSAGASNRATGGAGNKAGSAGASNRATGGAGAGGASASTMNRGGSGASGSRGASPSNGVSGGSRGYSGSSARASSSRGASSMGSRGGGGGRGGGGRR